MVDVNLITTLTTQAPGMAAIIIVVILFLKSIERRDALFIDSMNKITDRLTALESLIANHDANSRAAYNDRSDTLDRIEKKINQALPARKRT